MGGNNKGKHYNYKSQQIRQKICLNCGKGFSYIWKVSLDRMKFCSDKCRHDYHYQYSPKGNTFLICKSCGKNFIGRKNAKYCSPKCSHIRQIIIVDESGNKFICCQKCKEIKPLTSEFFNHLSQNKNIGFSTRCKSCCNKENQKWRKTERGKILRIKSRKRNIETTKRYREKYKPKRRILEAMERKTDPSFALKNRVRILMYATLRKVKNGRKWQNLVGYSIDDLRRHIEKQFKDGMSWERFMAGDIHIDHIIPVSCFNYRKPEDIDFKRCWALKNLQPLWATDNLRKHDKVERPFQPSLLI